MNEPLDRIRGKQYILRWPAADGTVIQSHSSLAAALAGLLQHEAACLRDAARMPPGKSLPVAGDGRRRMAAICLPRQRPGHRRRRRRSEESPGGAWPRPSSN